MSQKRKVHNTRKYIKSEPDGTEILYENEDGSYKQFDARNLHLPTLTVVGLIIFFSWITYFGANQKQIIDTRLYTLENNIMLLTKNVDSLINKIENKTNIKESWSKVDHSFWCLMAERENKGWKCPDDFDLNKQ